MLLHRDILSAICLMDLMFLLHGAEITGTASFRDCLEQHKGEANTTERWRSVCDCICKLHQQRPPPREQPEQIIIPTEYFEGVDGEKLNRSTNEGQVFHFECVACPVPPDNDKQSTSPPPGTVQRRKRQGPYFGDYYEPWGFYGGGVSGGYYDPYCPPYYGWGYYG